MRMVRLFVLASLTLLAVLFLSRAAAADVLFVDATAPGGGDGASWATAFDGLDAALAVAVAGDQLRVAQGDYRPRVGEPSVTRSFDVPQGVDVLGGWAGLAGVDPDARDPSVFLTRLDGDQLGDDVPYDLTQLRFDNSHHVVTIEPGPLAARLDGLVVRGGRAGSNVGGGAVLARGATLVAVDCTFEDSDAREFGGGVLVDDGGSASFDRCVFYRNAVGSNTSSGSVAGGGLSVHGAHAELKDCRFEGNRGRIVPYPAGVVGAGAEIGSTVGGEATGRLERCLFVDNHSDAVAGGVVADGAVEFVDCDFVGNLVAPGQGPFQSASAAGARISDGVSMLRCRFVGNVAAGGGGGSGSALMIFGDDCTVVSCEFLGNGRADLVAEAVSIFNSDDTLFANNTVAGNLTLFGTAGLSVGFSSANTQIRNSVFWGNTAGLGAGEGVQVADPDGLQPFSHCSIQGWTGALGGVGNLAADPLFVDLDGADDVLGTLDDDARLGAGSLAIDAADAASLPPDLLDTDCDGDLLEAVPLDLAGLVRAVDDPLTADTGPGSPPVDMGAHEFGSDLPRDVFTDLGGASTGGFGTPHLDIAGTFCEGQAIRLHLTNAPPGSLVLFLKALNSTPFPKYGGTVHAFPIFVSFLQVVKPNGEILLQTTVPDAVPSGFPLWYQYLIQDTTQVPQIIVSNGVRAVTP